MTLKHRAALKTLFLSLFVSACVGAPSQPGAMPAPPMAAAYGARQPLFGFDARRLITTYGEPRLDIRDRTVRKLQFMTGGCVLDTYLYTTARGQEPTVTHIDTRRPDGSDVDPASCGIR